MGETVGPAVESHYPVTIGALMLAFSWVADEAGYDLEQTNDVSQLILRAWRTVENHEAWQRAFGPPAQTRLVLDEVTETIPVVTVGADPRRPIGPDPATLESQRLSTTRRIKSLFKSDRL